MGTEHFDKAAADYDKKSRRIILADKISRSINKLPLSKQMSGMEFGCGTGNVGIRVAPSLRELTGIDTSQGMLDVFGQKVIDLGITNIQTLCCDFSFDSYTQKHDLIICAMTLHHIEDAKALLLHFTELLNPGGYLAVADITTEDGTFHDPSAKGIWHHGFDPEKLAILLKNFGLQDINSQIVHTIIQEEQNNKEFPVFLLTGYKNSH
jgi:tRNA (cmo5U34)-methyltransferase